MRRVDNIVESGKYLAVDRVYSAKRHTIYYTYDRDDQQTYLTKLIFSIDDKTAFYMLHHIRNNVLPYLEMRRCLREASFLSIPVEQAEVMSKYRGDLQHPDGEDQLREYRTKDLNKLLFFSKKYIPGKSLREMLQDKSEDLDWKFCYDLVGNVADFVLRFGGIKDLFVSADNIIIGEEGSFYLNHFSTVGMELIKFDKYIPRADFQEIFPYLTEQYLSQSEKDRKFNVQIRLNFIILNFLAAFIRSELVFDSKYILFETAVNKSSVMPQIADMEKTHLAQILSKKNREDLFKFDKEYAVSFYEIIAVVLKRDETYKKVTWKWVLERLSRQDRNMEQGLTIFMRNFMEIIDHYTQILAMLFSNNEDKTLDINQQRIRFQTKMKWLDSQFTFPTKDDETYLRNRDLQALIKTADYLKRQKQFYLAQDWYTQQLYIPIKTGMTFTRILQFRNWVHMLSEDTVSSVENVAAVIRLLQFVLEIENNICILQPYITEPIMMRSVEGKRINDKKTVRYEYCSNMLSFLNQKQQIQKHPDSDEDSFSERRDLNESGELSSEQHNPNPYSSCLQIFRSQLHATLNTAKGLFQKYYTNASSRPIATGLQASQQPESALLARLGKLVAQSGSVI